MSISETATMLGVGVGMLAAPMGLAMGAGYAVTLAWRFCLTCLGV